MNLYFQNSQGKLRLIAQPTSDKEVNATIKQFLDDHNYKSYYTRTWYEPEINRFVIDVGSYTEFFQCEVSKTEMDTLPDSMKKLMK